MVPKDKSILTSYLQRSGIWTAAKIIQALLILLIFYLYAVFLSKDAYGNYQKAFVLVGFLSGVFCFGFQALIAVLPLQNLESLLKEVMRKAAPVITALSSVFIIAIYFIFPEFTLLEKTGIIVLSILNAASLVYEVFVLKKSDDRLVLIINGSFSFFYLLIHLLILVTFYNLTNLLLLLILLTFVRLYWYYKEYRFFINSENPEKGLQTNSLFRQWGFITFNDIIEAFSKNIDKIILIGLISAADFAVYFNGSYEIPFLGLFIAVAGTFINLQSTQQQLDNHSVLKLFYTSAMVLASIVFPLFFFVWFYAAELFSWLFTNKYNNAVPFFLIYAWVIPLRINNYTAIIQNKLKSNIVVYGSLSALLIKLLLMLGLYPIWSIKGIALACVIGTYYQVAFYLYFTGRLLHIPFFKTLPFKELLLIFCISGLIIGSFFWISFPLKSFYLLLIAGFVTGLTMFLFLWFYVREKLYHL